MTIHLTQAQDTALNSCNHDYQVNCGNCRLNSICLPLALESDDIQQLDDIIQRSKPLQKHQHLYRESDDFQSVYAVRSGTIKAYKTTDDGREQVTGFYFPGEILLVWTALATMRTRPLPKRWRPLPFARFPSLHSKNSAP